MRWSLIRCLLLTSGLSVALSASTIYSQGGNSGSSQPLGYYSPYGTATVAEVSWTQNFTAQNVTISANLFTPGSPGSADFYLVTALGAGTSYAADGIAKGSVSTPINPANVLLTTLPTLGPGTYYLVLSSSVADTSWQYSYPFIPPPTPTMAPGVSYNGTGTAEFGGIDNSFAPGSAFSSVITPLEFSVEAGSITAVPEPTTLLLLCVGLALIVGVRKFRGSRGSPISRLG